MSKRPKKGALISNKETAPSPLPGKVTVLLREPVCHIILIVVLGFLIYSNTFNVPLAFDDQIAIAENFGIKDPQQFIFKSLSVRDLLINFFQGGNRYIGFLTFAFNYKIHALHVTGYHIVNLVIHLVNALLVYALVLLTFRTPVASDYLNRDMFKSFHDCRLIALFTALLFVSHPVQTQAVTYIVQRFTSLATLFYLASLVLYIKARVSNDTPLLRYVRYLASIIFTVVAMKTKEIAVTLPVMIILFELMFFKGEMKRRLLYLIPFLLTMFIIPLSLLGSKIFSSDVSAIDNVTRVVDANVSRWDYLITQFRVIVTYIRLMFLPIRQNLDYDYPVYRSFFHAEIILSFLFLLALFCFGVYLFYASFRQEKGGRFRLRFVSFGILWFFVALSVESSIIPIADVIFEHRLYLPSVGFFLALMLGVGCIEARSASRLRLIKRTHITVMIVLVVGLSVTAYARNTVWRDGITLWEDVVKKSPNKLRPHYALGLEHARRDRFDEALKEYQTALHLNPDYVPSLNDIGAIYIKQGRLDDAMKMYQRAVKLSPDYAEGHINMGVVYEKQGRLEDAIKEYQLAVIVNKNFVEGYSNLGVVYEKQGRLDDAIREHQAAIKINPDDAEAHSNLASVYQKQGNLDNAIREYRITLMLKPDYAYAYHRLGIIYFQMEKYDEAKALLQTAISLDPANVDARNDLAAAYAMLNIYEEAIREFQTILKIKPDHKNARSNLERLQERLKQRE